MTTSAPSQRPNPIDDAEWTSAMSAAEMAAQALLSLKRKAMAVSPQYEQVVWVRHHQRLQGIKRVVDAAVM